MNAVQSVSDLVLAAAQGGGGLLWEFDQYAEREGASQTKVPRVEK